MQKKTAAIFAIVKGAFLPLLILIVWEITVRAGIADTLFLPAPSTIFAKLVEMIGDGSLAENLLSSLVRLTYGFFIAVAVAIPMGVLIGNTKNLRYLLNPTLSFLQQIPPIAWIPVFILWLGIGEASKVAVIVYASFFPIFLNTVQGVTTVDPKLIEVGRAYMLTPFQMIRRVYIPSAAISIFVGLRLGLSNCWRALVGAEIIAASSGIGSLLVEGRQLFQPDKIFAAVLTIGLAGSLIDLFLKKLEVNLMPWRKMYKAGG